MKNTNEQIRISAVERYLSGESLSIILLSLKKSKSWFYKWLNRYDENDPSWSKEKSKRPHNIPQKTHIEIEEAVKVTRLSLCKNEVFHGAQAIQWEMKEINIVSIPSQSTINRILKTNDLICRRTERYIPKGKKYPSLLSEIPNNVHQADFVGPLYLNGPIRFYNLNVVDIATGRCGIQPIYSRNSQNCIDSFWSIWFRMGIPQHIQVDNELVFSGSNRYPRGMGPLIRLCLLYDIELWFIPVREPWRNGVVEKFNYHYQQKFIQKVVMSSKEELLQKSILYEQKHNTEYRYSKLNGRTPMKTLQESEVSLKYPPYREAPIHPLPKPTKGKYHFVRFIRNDLNLMILTEKFKMPSELMYEYIIATVDVAEQKLKIFHDNKQLDEFTYLLL